jgi:hypothetical protein
MGSSLRVISALRTQAAIGISPFGTYGLGCATAVAERTAPHSVSAPHSAAPSAKLRRALVTETKSAVRGRTP